MRVFIFLVIVLFFFLSGAWLMANKDAKVPYEIPYLDGQSMDLSFGTTADQQPEKASRLPLPVEAWKDILIGEEWQFTTVFYGVDNILRFEGDISFNPDGTFTRYVTIHYYKGSPTYIEETKDYLASVSGGSVSGQWGIVDDGVPLWYEKIKKCNGKLSYNSVTNAGSKHICDLFKNNKVFTYGTKQEELGKYKVTTLKKDHIVIEGKTYDNEGRRVYILQRSAN